MATIEKKGNGWCGQFLYQGRRRYFTIGKVTEAEARAKADQVGYLVMRLNQGPIQLPPGVDVVDFVKRDGAAPTESSLDKETYSISGAGSRHAG
ncbi:hypothetical protein [Planctomyces sp. SH-PL62]|uniref:hypothetical protein n=1 Tax=Planctomyces sp. SH-PL62 TaxID=1636152 RepID=UPI00078BC70E|nr:hypothetical protein [Planctomyces sp. SH-PL62]AMV38429.1 hypothetical protein VT85_13410 [Planctomyces sp. SH-PL62]